MNVYLDESGDLGWTFDKPYRNGGSSRFLTIAFVLCPPEKKHLLKRLVNEVYQKYHINPRIELKGSALTNKQKEFVAQKIANLLERHNDIKIKAITVKKERVVDRMRVDPNKLYNYMIKLALLECIKDDKEVHLIRDNRTIKVKSGNSLIEYLQINLTFEMEVETIVHDYPTDSKSCKNLMFIDWVNNIVWIDQEDRNSSPFSIIKDHVSSIHLYYR